MSESMDKYYKNLLLGVTGAKLGSAIKGGGPGSLVAAAAGARSMKKAFQKSPKKLKKGGVVK